MDAQAGSAVHGSRRLDHGVRRALQRGPGRRPQRWIRAPAACCGGLISGCPWRRAR
jgi:hypothetical protein